MALVIQKDIPRLDVSVNLSSEMQVLQSLESVAENRRDFILLESFLS
jgi:hypothetical protein